MRNRVAELRKANGWTRRGLALRLGVTEATVINIESGKHAPRMETMFRIGLVFDKELGEIFFADDVQDVGGAPHA